MDDSHNGGNPPANADNKIAHRNGTARILFSVFNGTHDVDSIMVTHIAIQDSDCKGILTTIQNKQKFKALVKNIETKVKIVRRNRHWAVVEDGYHKYTHADCCGYTPLVFSHTELKSKINMMWRNVAETQMN